MGTIPYLCISFFLCFTTGCINWWHAPDTIRFIGQPIQALRLHTMRDLGHSYFYAKSNLPSVFSHSWKGQPCLNIKRVWIVTCRKGMPLGSPRALGFTVSEVLCFPTCQLPVKGLISHRNSWLLHDLMNSTQNLLPSHTAPASQTMD